MDFGKVLDDILGPTIGDIVKPGSEQNPDTFVVLDDGTTPVVTEDNSYIFV